jgi:CHAD domain-containing protein
VVRRFREVEIEAIESDASLPKLARKLEKAGARPSDARPKLFRALGTDLRPPPVDRSAPASEHVHAMLRAQLDALRSHDPSFRLAGGPEDVHQLRVATRRLRAVLRAAKPLLDEEWASAVRSELGWLASALGTSRDLDVIIEQLAADGQALGPEDAKGVRSILSALERERKEHRARAVAELSNPRYAELLKRLAGAPPFREGDATLHDIAAGEFRRLRKTMRALPPDPPDDELHAARIRAKRARYAAELAERAVGKPAAEFVRRAKAFQDVVGEHQDAVVAEARLRELARRGGSARAIAAGRLVDRQRERRARAREEYPKAWRRLEQAGRRAWT